MEKDIDIDGLNIHYEETGPSDAPVLLLMHGWGCDHTTVRSVADCVNDKMRVVNVDLPGHGRSSEPNKPWGIEQYTVLIEKFVDKVIKGPVSLSGHSFGGRVAILFASRNNVNRVVLIDSAGVKPKRSLKYYWKVYTFKLIKNILLIFLGKEKGAEMVEALRGKKGSADYRNSSPMMRKIMSICVNEDLKHIMPSISAPTLLIWGENDTATPITDARTMNRLIPDSGLVSFPQCGHYSFLDNPYGFKAVMKEFFKQTEIE